MKKKLGIQARASSDAALDVYLFGPIGGLEDDWGGVSAKGLLRALAEKPDAAVVNLHINSPGGDVFEGVAIYNTLKASKARVVVHIDGLAASAASFVAMAGDEIRIAKNAMMMIHEVSIWMTGGRSEDLQKKADIINKLNETLVDIYLPRAEKAGKTRDDVIAAMAAETWFTAEEAVAWGLADTITDTEADAEVVALASARPRARELFTRFAAMAGGRKSETGMKMKIKASLAKKIGLRAEATEEEVVEKLEETVEKVEQVEEELDEKDQRIKELEAKIAELEAKLAELEAQKAEQDEAIEEIKKEVGIEQSNDAPTSRASVTALLGKLAGLKARARETDAIKARLADLEAKELAREIDALIAQGRASGQITPANEAKLREKGPEFIRAYLETAPRVVPGTVRQPAVQASASGIPVDKPYEELTIAQRTALAKTNPELFNSLRADWIQRNRPSAKAGK